MDWIRKGKGGEAETLRKGCFDLRMAGLWKGYFSDGLVCTLSALLCSTLRIFYSAYCRFGYLIEMQIESASPAIPASRLGRPGSPKLSHPRFRSRISPRLRDRTYIDKRPKYFAVMMMPVKLRKKKKKIRNR
jgi:hypothetical protein